MIQSIHNSEKKLKDEIQPQWAMNNKSITNKKRELMSIDAINSIFNLPRYELETNANQQQIQ